MFRARSRAVQKASVAAWMRKEATAADQGAVWREVSYSLRETQARRQLRTGAAKGARKVSPGRRHRLAFVTRVQPVDGQVGASPSRWAGSVPEGGPCSGMAPLARAGYDLRIDTGEVIGSGLYWNHGPPVGAGAGPGTPSERPGPGVPRRASAAAT